MFKKLKEEFGAIANGSVVDTGNFGFTITSEDVEIEVCKPVDVVITRSSTIVENNKYGKHLYDEDTAKYEGILKHAYFNYMPDYELDNTTFLCMLQFQNGSIIINSARYRAAMIENIKAYILSSYIDIDFDNADLAVTENGITIKDRNHTGGKDYWYYLHTNGKFTRKELNVAIDILNEIKLSNKDAGRI